MIEIKNLSKVIGNRKILDNINLSFSCGFTCVVGDSGAGKSTLLNAIGGLDIPTSGEIIYKDNEGKTRDIKDISDYKKCYLGFVFQESNLISGLTAYENIELSMQISNGQASTSDINSALMQFGLQHVANTKAENLSGGEKLRTSIARAVIKNAPIILADEPTGNLDHDNSLQIFEMLKSVSRNHIVIAVTHNLEMARRYADRIITIRDGKIENDEVLHAELSNNTIDVASPNTMLKDTLSHQLIKRLTFNNIKRFKAKFVLSLLSMGIALVALAIIITTQTNMQEKTQEMNTVYYDADIITFYPYELGEKNPTSIMMGDNFGTISDQMLTDIKNSNLFSEIVPVYNVPFYLGDSEMEVDYKLINKDTFFEDRLMTEGVEGNFPTEDNQIIISKNIADAYFDGDAIGKEITFITDFGCDLSYEIVGINAEKNVDGINYTYIPLNSISGANYNEMPSLIYLKSTVENDNEDIFTEDASGFISTPTDETVIYGDKITGKKQILISPDMARDIYHSITGSYIDISTDSILTDRERLKDSLNVILNQNYYISANDAYECKVVGIHDGESYKVLVAEDWKNDITRAIPNCVECYGKDMQTIKDFGKDAIAQKYSFISNYEERFENAVSATGLWNIMFVVIFIVVGILCVVMIHSYEKSAISARMYEVGILETLGLNNKKIKKILQAETCILGLGAWCCSSILYILYAILFKLLLHYQFYILDIAKVLTVLLLGVAIVIWFTSSVEVSKVTKKTIIETIRMRE